MNEYLEPESTPLPEFPSTTAAPQRVESRTGLPPLAGAGSRVLSEPARRQAFEVPRRDAGTAPVVVEEPRKRRTPGFLAGIVAAAVIAASGFGLGRLTADTNNPVQVNTVAASTPTTITSTTTAPPAVVAPTPTTPAVVGDLEPVAAAAAAVAPAVVQIDTNSGLGSGVIYDAQGYILTAAHVVEGSRSVTVRLADGTSVGGTVVGTHDATDVAVVSIDPTAVLAVATLADGSELTVGQTAVAVGSPFGLDQTVTSGIVSATDRIVSNITMVQTDAAINPGNSGGPLVDLRGRVIGINDQIFTNSGGNEGVGFAISIDLAVIVADQLVAGDNVGLAFLGVSMTSPANGDSGALIQSVVAGSAAAEGGLQVGDLVVAVNGDPIRDGSDLRAEIITLRPGTTVEITVERDGSGLTRTITLGATD
ncbi:MAG: trypsin-like peptidase domain-containing protein [Acidimicrobiia bacterium]|nr:trypsin-like peptidase domain-containing protein [Acidimicrobiia bacterium]NNC76260.1 PDZ domain-containing protein [Acidimicrobiia bacterium]